MSAHSADHYIIRVKSGLRYTVTDIVLRLRISYKRLFCLIEARRAYIRHYRFSALTRFVSKLSKFGVIATYFGKHVALRQFLDYFYESQCQFSE